MEFFSQPFKCAYIIVLLEINREGGSQRSGKEYYGNITNLFCVYCVSDWNTKKKIFRENKKKNTKHSVTRIWFILFASLLILSSVDVIAVERICVPTAATTQKFSKKNKITLNNDIHHEQFD